MTVGNGMYITPLLVITGLNKTTISCWAITVMLQTTPRYWDFVPEDHIFGKACFVFTRSQQKGLKKNKMEQDVQENQIMG
ncbi:hypothetical protein ES708_04329 [subsurface metagenome]